MIYQRVRGFGLLATLFFAFGVTVWFPAVGLTFGLVSLQPMDILSLMSWAVLPVVLHTGDRFTLSLLLVLLGSMIFNFAFSNAVFIVSAWHFVFVVPFVILASIAVQNPYLMRNFIGGFFLSGFFCLGFFFFQLFIGAENADFRNNLNFKLPPQYDRGFSFFPEVSTLACHAVMLLGTATAMWAHPQSSISMCRLAFCLVVLSAVSLAFTKSTTALVLSPVIVLIAVASVRKLTTNTLILGFLVCVICSVFTYIFVELFYVDRLENSSAIRSTSMRFASIVGGFIPLTEGSVFGVGIGQNDQVSSYAYKAAVWFDLKFGKIPNGINSHVVTRIFEEGWSGIANLALGLFFLVKSRRVCKESPIYAGVYVLAVSSFLCSLMVIGYRGIYMNWFWLGVAGGLMNRVNEAGKQVSWSKNSHLGMAQFVVRSG